VIYINQHSRQQDEPVFFPVRFVIPVCNSANKDEVEKIMGDGLKQWYRDYGWMFKLRRIRFSKTCLFKEKYGLLLHKSRLITNAR